MILDDRLYDLVDAELRMEADCLRNLLERRNAPHHILEAFAVDFAVRNEANLGSRFGQLANPLGEIEDRHLVQTSDVEHLAHRVVSIHQADGAGDSVGHVREAPSLPAVAVNDDGSVGESLLNEIGQHHAVFTGLARAHSIEKPANYNRKVLLAPVRDGEKLIDGLRAGVAPAT